MCLYTLTDVGLITYTKQNLVCYGKGRIYLGGGGGDCSWVKKDVYWIKDSSGQKHEHGDGGRAGGNTKGETEENG